MSILALTSKMGAFSFNLPAGPASVLGTCPAAAYGWPKHMPGAPKGAGPARSEAFRGMRVDPKRWICANCYGLKNAYGNPSMIFCQECRRQAVKYWLKERVLANVLELAIRAGQRFFVDHRKRSKAPWEIPDPRFFRIHDVGDCGLKGRGYFEAWCEVARRCSVPVGDLPAVTFWMPTRLWTIKGMTPKDIPPNMNVRPSALHFNDHAPVVPGLSAGSTSTTIHFDYKQQIDPKELQAAVHAVGKLAPQGPGWICPAYLPPHMRGGARVPHVKKKGVKYTGGTCVLAWGVGERPCDEGGEGCRTCWAGKLRMTYPAH